GDAGVAARPRHARPPRVRVVPAEQAVRMVGLQGAGQPVRARPVPADAVGMESLLLFPDPAPPALAQALDLGGYPWKAAASVDGATRIQPDDRCARARG